MKKVISVLVMTAVLLSMTACNNEQEGNSGISAPNPVSSGGSTENKSDSSGSVSTSESTDSAPESREESSQITQSTDESTSHDKPVVPTDNQGGEMSGSVLVLDDGRAIDLYGGGYERGQNYAETLNKLKQMVGDNVNVFSLVAPTAVSFYLPDDLAYMSGSEWDNIDYLNGYLDAAWRLLCRRGICQDRAGAVCSAVRLRDGDYGGLRRHYVRLQRR